MARNLGFGTSTLKISILLLARGRQVERRSGAERARAAISSAPEEPSVLELGNVGKCGVFDQPGRTISSARARAAISSAPAEPSGLEQVFRAPQRSRAGSSGHFERPSGAERARRRKRRRVRRFR